MTANVKINPEQVARLMWSDGIVNVTRDAAKQIRRKVSPYGDFQITGPYGEKRPHFNVYTADDAAIIAESRDDVLSIAVRRGVIADD